MSPLEFIEQVAMEYEGSDCLLWPFARDQKGYARITSVKGVRSASRLVCKLANGEPPTPKYDAAHSCGNGGAGCVTKHHLRWATSKENNADKLIHGTLARGSKNGASKLTEEIVRDIKRNKGIKGPRELARLYGVHRTCIQKIFQGIQWGHINV